MGLKKIVDLDRLSRFKDKILALIPQIDTTLTQQGQAADAKATGDALNEKQPKPYMFGVFHDTDSDADPEYEVQKAPSTVSELLQLMYSGTSVSLEISNMDLPEATYINGEIYPLGANTIGVLFKRMEPVVDIQTIAMTGANANAVGLVGIYSGSVDSNITWQFYDLGNMPLATKAEVPTKVSDLTNDSGFITGYTETDPTVPEWAKASSKPTYTASEVGALPSTTTYAASPQVGGSATYANGLHFAQVDSTSTETAFTVTIPGITEYYDGLTIILKNGVVTSASGFTINVNGLGAKHSYNNLAAATADTTIFNINYTMMFVYDSTRVSGGGWICYRGYDANTNTIGYQLRTNSTTMPMSEITYRYRLFFTSADGKKFVPANTSSSTNATATRTVNQTPIDPHGNIVYYGATASVAAGSRPAAASLWTRYVVTLGYSFNRAGAALTLTSHAPVYIKAAPQANGSAIIDATTPYVQALPTTADGMIYIFLGTAASATTVELVDEHPIYCYRNGSIQHWTGVQSEIDALAARLDALVVLDEEEF